MKMNDLTVAIQKMVDEAVQRAQPSNDEFITKKDAVKELKILSARQYLRAKEAAVYLGISKATFWNWRKKNHIKSYTIDDVTVYKKTDLDDFMERRATKNG